MKYVLYLFYFFAALLAAGFIAGRISALKEKKITKTNVLPPQTGTGGSDDAVKQLARNGRVIEAIKLYRELHGCGLKEAKDAVDKFSNL
jgi:pentatricopeptide repeat protein